MTHHGFDFNIGGTNSRGPSGTNAYFAQQKNNGNWVFANSHGPELDVYAMPYTQQYIDDNLTPFANGNDPKTLVGTPKHLNDAMADATIDFLADRVADNEPFIVNVAFNVVHTVVNSPLDLETKYSALTSSTMPQHDDPAYAGLLEGMDQAIGRIVDYVSANGRGGNTLIVFMLDNGGAGATDNFPLRDSKGSFHDGGIRVPMICYQPGTIAAGTTTNEQIHLSTFTKRMHKSLGQLYRIPQFMNLTANRLRDCLRELNPNWSATQSFIISRATPVKTYPFRWRFTMPQMGIVTNSSTFTKIEASSFSI